MFYRAAEFLIHTEALVTDKQNGVFFTISVCGKENSLLSATLEFMGAGRLVELCYLVCEKMLKI